MLEHDRDFLSLLEGAGRRKDEVRKKFHATEERPDRGKKRVENPEPFMTAVKPKALR